MIRCQPMNYYTSGQVKLLASEERESKPHCLYLLSQGIASFHHKYLKVKNNSYNYITISNLLYHSIFNYHYK